MSRNANKVNACLKIDQGIQQKTIGVSAVVMRDRSEIVSQQWITVFLHSLELFPKRVCVYVCINTLIDEYIHTYIHTYMGCVLFTCPYPLKVQTRSPRDHLIIQPTKQPPTIQSTNQSLIQPTTHQATKQTINKPTKQPMNTNQPIIIITIIIIIIIIIIVVVVVILCSFFTCVPITTRYKRESVPRREPTTYQPCDQYNRANEH